MKATCVLLFVHCCVNKRAMQSCSLLGDVHSRRSVTSAAHTNVHVLAQTGFGLQHAHKGICQRAHASNQLKQCARKVVWRWLLVYMTMCNHSTRSSPSSICKPLSHDVWRPYPPVEASRELSYQHAVLASDTAGTSVVTATCRRQTTERCQSLKVWTNAQRAGADTTFARS